MKIKVFTDAHVEADLSAAVYRPSNPDDYAKQLERAVKEFNDFVRDHRSMDWVHLHVVREYENQCSHCGSLWESSIDDDGKPCCCQEAINEYEAKKELTT